MTECPQHIKNRDGVIRAVRCRRWDCPTCGPLHAAHVIAASRTMDFDQLIGATFRADDFEKVWKRIRVRIPGLSYIAVIHHKPDHHVHLAFTGCTADDFLRHATAAGASNVYALPCRNPVDYIAYITRQRMDSSDSRISHSRDITYALRRARALDDDPVRFASELMDIRTARAHASNPEPPAASGRAVGSPRETVSDHPGTGPDRCSARPDTPPADILPMDRSSSIGLLLALLADNPGRIMVTIQLEVPAHVPSKIVPTPADQPAAGSQHPAESADDSHVVAHASSGRRAQPEAAPQAAASARSAAQETRDEETVEEESGPEAGTGEETVEEEMTS